jgi:DNA modification methylase
MIDPHTSAFYTGDCRTLLAQLPDACVQTCCTSPPYWALRDYGVDGQIGLEETPEAYVAELVTVFAEVRRVLADDGTLWLNLGDAYSHGGCGSRDPEKWPKQSRNDHMATHAKRHTDLKPKDLIGLPWMVAFALRADGWYLRSEIIWEKATPMPESVRDRPTKAHEQIFLLAKNEAYFYDCDAIKEPLVSDPKRWGRHAKKDPGAMAVRSRPMFGEGRGGRDGTEWGDGETRNKRSVWRVTSAPYPDAHFATFPPALIEPCVLAGSRPGDLVLDPFFGSGTTGMVAEKHGRRWIGFDLNPAYAELAARRTAQRSLMTLMADKA